MDRETLRLLATLAHELRTPLSAIGGHAELLELGVHGPLLGAQVEGLLRIKHNQIAAVALIDKFMSYAEAAAGALTLNSETFSLEALIERCMLSSSSGRRHFDHDTSSARGAFTNVHMDLRACQSMLEALFQDAVAHSEDGGAIRVITSTAEFEVVVVVESVSLPLSEAVADRLFLPFDRPACISDAREPSAHLSLPRARLLARALGGDIRGLTDRQYRALALTLPRAGDRRRAVPP